jgi:hypothetical protein
MGHPLLKEVYLELALNITSERGLPETKFANDRCHLELQRSDQEGEGD